MQMTPMGAAAPGPTQGRVGHALVLDPEALHHIVVVACAGTPEIDHFVECAARAAPPAQVLQLARYANVAALAEDLRGRLARAAVGVRLFLCAPQQVLWDLHALARSAGLIESEIALHAVEEAQRRVFCVHCGTLQSGDPDGTTCRSCGVKLLVRDHFSARLGAYMGVCADADRPYAQASR